MRIKYLLLCLLAALSVPASAFRLPWNKSKQPTETMECYLKKQALSVYDVESIDVYQSGADKYESLLQDMQQAEHHIHCEYFIFANDSIANRLLSVMKQKAAQGVECRLVVDGYYDRKRGYRYDKRLQQLRKQGIEVYVYEPYKFPYVHRVLRDHRKIVVIDGKVGYTGGFNVADYNIKGKPGIYGRYVDTQVRLEGQAVESLQHLFAQHFEKAGGKGFDGDVYYPYTSQCYTGQSGRQVAVLERGRQCKEKKREMRRAVCKFIDKTQDSLHITSPYLLPIPSVRRAIHRAVKRGVHVEVLYSEKGDTPLLDAGNLHYAHHLQRQGVEIWLYQRAFQHSKIMMADGNRCIVGSVNMDSRAMRWNEEVAAVIFDSETTQWLDSTFVHNQRNAHKLSEVYYKNLPFSLRIKGFFANYFLTWCL